MKKFGLSLLLALAVGVALRLAAGPGGAQADYRVGGTVKTNIQVAARVDAFAEWADASPVIFEADWSGHITQVNQRQTASRQMILYANTDAVIAARPGLNNGILTQGSYTLETAYRLTGAVGMADRGFVPAQQFFSSQNMYPLAHVAGTGAYAITLEMQAASPPADAPEQGVYTCGLTLTAAW